MSSSSSVVTVNDAGPWCVVALGSNLGDSKATLLEAMDRLQSMMGGQVLRSSLWRSTPVDCPPGSPEFLNAVVAWCLPKIGTPEDLLERLQALEREFGRRPKLVLNEARPLDLDLILWGEEVRATEKLALPHPRAHLRQFVLRPLQEILPDLRFPGRCETVSDLHQNLRSAEIVERLPSD